MQYKQSAILHKLSGRAFIALAIAFSSVGAHAQTAGLLQKLTGKTNEPVDPELAFSVKIRNTGPQQAALDFSVRPGYYLYRERISVALKDAPAWRIKNIEFPPTTIKEDKILGRTMVYTKSFSVPVKLEGKSGSPASLLVQYQGCFEALGVCYPPVTTTLKMTP